MLSDRVSVGDLISFLEDQGVEVDYASLESED